MAVTGLYETHLTVSDLDRSVAFYRDVVGLELAHELPSRRAAFFWVGSRERSMLGLWGHAGPLRLRLHLAFSVTFDELVRSIGTLRDRDVVPRGGGGGAAISEPVVHPWMPAASVYFDDPDGHSLEYIAVLDDAPDAGLSSTVPWSEWQRTRAKSAA